LDQRFLAQELGNWNAVHNPHNVLFDALPDRPQSAASVARAELREVIIELASPADLNEIASKAPSLVAEILTRQTDSNWWLAWLALPDSAIDNSLAAVGDQGVGLKSEMILRACSALVASEPSPHRDAVWERLAIQDTRFALEALISNLASRPGKSGEWRSVLARHEEQLVAVLEATPPNDWLAILSELVPASRPILSRGTRPWLPLAASDHLAKLQRGLGLLMLVGLKDRTPDPAFLASVYARLYRRLAESAATEEWRLIESELPGSKSDWDRCRRLAQGVARKIASRSRRSRSKTIHLAAAEYSPAGKGLEDELHKRGLLPISFRLGSSD